MFVKWYEVMVQLILNSKLVVLNNCGYLFSLEVLSVVVDMLCMWLKELEFVKQWVLIQLIVMILLLVFDGLCC